VQNICSILLKKMLVIDNTSV